MDRRHRLTSSRDFARVMRAGRRARTGPLTVVVLATGEERPPRIGIAASRLVGPAVRRNRVKRLIREAIRRVLPSLPSGTDVVISARRPVDARGLDDVEREVRAALGQVGIAC